MKARIPKHREFIINLAEDYEKKDECWDKLQEIMEAYKKEGKSVYTPTFIEDNEDKVKALQKQYGAIFPAARDRSTQWNFLQGSARAG